MIYCRCGEFWDFEKRERISCKKITSKKPLAVFCRPVSHRLLFNRLCHRLLLGRGRTATGTSVPTGHRTACRLPRRTTTPTLTTAALRKSIRTRTRIECTRVIILQALSISTAASATSVTCGVGYNNGSNGTVNIFDGELDAGIYIGNNNGSSGTVNMFGGEINTSLYLGYSTGSNGIFNMYSGIADISTLFLGSATGATGTCNLDGGALESNYSYIGWNGTGIFNQTGGYNDTTFMSLGYKSAASGTYNLSAGTVTTDFLYIGRDGSGQFNQTGGNNTALYLYMTDSSGYTLEGGTLSINLCHPSQRRICLQRRQRNHQPQQRRHSELLAFYAFRHEFDILCRCGKHCKHLPHRLRPHNRIRLLQQRRSGI